MPNFKIIILSLLVFLIYKTGLSQTFTKDENGAFKGIVESSRISKSIPNKDKGPIGSYKISFAIWTLMGEPVYDFKFLWEFNENYYWEYKADYGIKRLINAKELRKYNDLYQRIKNITPLPDLKIQTKVTFWLDTLDYLTHENVYLTMNIDLPEKAGKDCFSVPESPAWENLFSSNIIQDLNYESSYSKNNIKLSSNKSRGRLNEFLLKYSDRLDMHEVMIVKCDWPEHEINSILEEYLCREKKLENCKDDDDNDNAKNTQQSKDDFWDGEDDKKEEVIDNNDDFWSGGSVKQDNQDSNNETDFWSGKGTTAEEKRLTENTKPDESDQFIGNVRSRTGRIRIYCWDTGQEDGDKVRITNNGTILRDNIYLTNAGRSYWFALEFGQNNIEILALNQGSVGANTAAFKVFDDKGNLIAKKSWHLETGYKGKLLILKL